MESEGAETYQHFPLNGSLHLRIEEMFFGLRHWLLLCTSDASVESGDVSLTFGFHVKARILFS